MQMTEKFKGKWMSDDSKVCIQLKLGKEFEFVKDGNLIVIAGKLSLYEGSFLSVIERENPPLWVFTFFIPSSAKFKFGSICVGAKY